MRVILYLPDYNRAGSCGYNATMALSEGLKKLGIDHDVRKTKHFERDGSEIADIAIVNGWLKKFIVNRNQKNRTQVIEAQAAAGKPAWCIERGFLLNREEWHAFSIGGFSTKGGPGGRKADDGWTGDFRAENMPSDRWDKLGIELQPWRTGGDYILLCAQVPWDAQVDDGNHLEWLEQTAQEIRKHTDRPIRFRPHPKAYRRRDPYGGLSAEFFEMVDMASIDLPPTDDFETSLAGAHAVVCYNSNVATLCNIAGVPVFTGAPCLADPIACRDLKFLSNDPIRLSIHLTDMREQWANDMGYRQWHTEEFRTGEPWLHLMRD